MIILKLNLKIFILIFMQITLSVASAAFIIGLESENKSIGNTIEK